MSSRYDDGQVYRQSTEMVGDTHIRDGDERLMMVTKHGVKRTRISPEALEAKRLKELAKIEAYTTLQEDVLARVSCVNHIYI